MSKVAKTPGQVLVDTIEAFFSRYLAWTGYPTPHQPLVSALWVILSWVSERFPMAAYVHVSAAGPGCGKTIWLELAKRITRLPEVVATVRPLAAVRLIEACQGLNTYMQDEAEKLANPNASEMVSIYATGYRKGGTHLVSMGGGKFGRFATWCHKAFASIGDLKDVLRERCIVLYLFQGKPVADLWREMDAADAEGERINGMIAGVIGRERDSMPMPMVSPDFLEGREREIWTPVFSLAHALKLDAETMERLTAAMVDLAHAKTLPPRPSVRPAMLAATVDRTHGYAVALLADLQRIAAEEGQPAHLRTTMLVERLRGLAVAPWRHYGTEQTGITAESMAGLLERFGLRPKQKRIAGVSVRGFDRAKVLAAVEGITGSRVNAKDGAQ